jgi:hypothetical protein
VQETNAYSSINANLYLDVRVFLSLDSIHHPLKVVVKYTKKKFDISENSIKIVFRKICFYFCLLICDANISP